MGNGRSDAFQVGVYGTKQFGSSYVSAAGAYGWHHLTTNRTVIVAGSDTLTAGFDASNVAGRLEAGHRFATPIMLGITPYAAAQVQAFFLPSYAETASSGSNQFALSYASHTATATRGELGLWVDSQQPQNITVFSRLAWAHDWNNDTGVTAAFQS